jgi:hypothetical protein
MQAALKDISSHGHNTPSFAVCQRVLHACHEIIFGDPAPHASPYGQLSLPSKSRFSRRKVKQNLEPAIIGIGMVLAGTPAIPQLTQIMGQVALEQGRIEESSNAFRGFSTEEENIASGSQNHQNFSEEDQEEDDSPDSDDTHTPAVAVRIPNASTMTLPNLPTRRTVKAAQTVPALPLHLGSIRRSRSSQDPFGQLDSDVSIPYSSSPSIYSARPSIPSATMSRGDALLGTYDPQTQAQLLRGHYCRSEVCTSFNQLPHNSSSRTG